MAAYRTQALVVVDVQASFEPPDWLQRDIGALASTMGSVATVERHDEGVVPFERQLGWKPGPQDVPLVSTDQVFVKYGHLPPEDMLSYLVSLKFDHVLVCGLQADICVLAASFALFDAGLRPSLLPWLTLGLAGPVEPPRRTALATPFRIRVRTGEGEGASEGAAASERGRSLHQSSRGPIQRLSAAA